MSTSADDPWDWSIDQVIACLTAPTGHLRTNYARYRETGLVAETIRENDVFGEVLLTEITDSVLKDDFGIGSIGQRSQIKRIIEDLQDRSAKFKQWHQRKTLRAQALASRPDTPSVLHWALPALESGRQSLDPVTQSLNVTPSKEPEFRNNLHPDPLLDNNLHTIADKANAEGSSKPEEAIRIRSGEVVEIDRTGSTLR